MARNRTSHQRRSPLSGQSTRAGALERPTSQDFSSVPWVEGKVKSFNTETESGFLQIEGYDKDAFFRAKAGPGIPVIRTGDRVHAKVFQHRIVDIRVHSQELRQEDLKELEIEKGDRLKQKEGNTRVEATERPEPINKEEDTKRANLKHIFDRADEIEASTVRGRPSEGSDYQPKSQAKIRLDERADRWLKAKGKDRRYINALLLALIEAEAEAEALDRTDAPSGDPAASR